LYLYNLFLVKKSGRYESKVKGERILCLFVGTKNNGVMGEAEREADKAAG
jgi:hypothetical protein